MAVIATGFFDGVHPGHRLVIDTLLSEARRRGEQSVVVTFWPHPRAVLQNGADSLRYLTSHSERDALIRSLGVDSVETLPFTRRFAALSAREYLEVLKRDFGCTEVVLGYDTRFGSGQAGPEEISDLARSMGMEAVITPPVIIDGAPVSSTRIRQALENGDTALAARLLGRPYRLHGVVVTGDRIGRTIGFPTANMKLYEPLMCVPKNGVYATGVIATGAPFRRESFEKLPLRCIPPTDSAESAGPSHLSEMISPPVVPQGTSALRGDHGRPWFFEALPVSTAQPSLLRGMTNIGVRPTVSERSALTIETYIFDFDEMIYGLDITVEFHERIRDERKFASLQELREQLLADCASIR